MNNLIFFHVNKVNPQNRTATDSLFTKLDSGEWQDVYWGCLAAEVKSEYMYKLNKHPNAYYIYVHYWHENNEKLPMKITICNVKINEEKVQAKKVCTLSSEEYVNYIMEEAKIIIHEDFEKIYDYIKVIDNEEIYNRLDIFATKNAATQSINDRSFPLREDSVTLHDVNAISFSKSFRRMQDKAQIFTLSKGDHYRTRLTHTNDVVRIGKLIARKINIGLKKLESEFLIDEDEVEAIALGHDIGHTPFGHQGERTLNDIINGKLDIIPNGGDNLVHDMGGFKHNVQSVRTLTHIEEESLNYDGLNISYRVLEGILKHSKYSKNDVLKLIELDVANNLNLDAEEDKNCFEDGKIKDEYNDIKYANTYLTGKIVNIADEIAQRGSDIEDAVKSKKIKIKELISCFAVTKYERKMEDIKKQLSSISKVKKYDKKNINLYLFKDIIINWLIDDITSSASIKDIKSNHDNSNLWFSEDIERLNGTIEDIIRNKVVMSQEVTMFDNNAKKIIAKLFKEYYENPRLLNDNTIHRIMIDMLNNKFTKHYAVDFRNMNKDYVTKVIEDINDIDGSVYAVLQKLTPSDEDKIVNKTSNELENLLKEDPNEYDRLMLKVRYEQQKIIIRNICDYIAGMSDSFALEECNKI